MVLGELAPIIMYLLLLNIIPGLNCTSPWFQTHSVHYYTPKERGMKLNHHIYIGLHEFRC